MFTRLKFAAILLIMSQCIVLNSTNAETQIIENPAAAQPAATGDAIQQFVSGDFAKRRALLNQWPASIELLDQLSDYVTNDQLYSDSVGNTYILKAEDKLLSYPDLTPVETWPSDLSQVTLVNLSLIHI